MPEGHDTTIEVSNIMSFVLYTQILKQSVLKPASPGITLTKVTLYGEKYFYFQEKKGRDPTQSYDKSPYTNRKFRFKMVHTS